MLALAGEIADGVLLDWPAPNYVVDATEIVARGAAEIRGHDPGLAAMSSPRLGARGSQSCAEKLSITRTSLLRRALCTDGRGTDGEYRGGEDAAALERGLEPYDAVLDETVVRAVVAEEAARARGYLELYAAAPGTGAGSTL